MDAPLSISLVIPAFNESAVIARAIAEAESALGQSFRQFEVIVVDDGSRDDTVQVIRDQLPYSPNTKLIEHGTNRGYGSALNTGFRAARYPLVAFTDADCQFDLTELRRLAQRAAEFDIVVGYRVDRKDPWRRRFFSRGYNFLARTFVGTRVRDVDCALKVFHRAILDSLLPESRGFFVNTEMMTKARLQGLTICEEPVSHRPRFGGESKVSLLEIPKTFRKLVGFWWSHIVRGPKALPMPTRIESWRATATVDLSSESPPQIVEPLLAMSDRR
jgi:glycosyltransferase involved in cell wall biosynthesis